MFPICSSPSQVTWGKSKTLVTPYKAKFQDFQDNYKSAPLFVRASLKSSFRSVRRSLKSCLKCKYKSVTKLDEYQRIQGSHVKFQVLPDKSKSSMFQAHLKTILQSLITSLDSQLILDKYKSILKFLRAILNSQFSKSRVSSHFPCQSSVK